jgi:hypothetical protein
VPTAPAAARRLLAALALALLGAGVALLWRFTVDDAYITLRYSRHLAIGLGPTFNETGPRAEGYTTFLWMLLLAIPHWLRVDALAVAKALGVVCSLVTALLSARWARRVAGDAAAGWAAPVAALLFVSRATTPVHAVSGMETALYTLLLTAVFASASEAVLAPEGRWARAWPLFALLAGLTRPEGNLVAGGTLVAVLALSPRVWRGRVLARAAALWWVPLAAYQLWRWHWYGLPLPLAFYLKLSDPELLPGARFVLDWMRGHGFALGVLLLPALVPPPRSLRPALTGVLAAAAFFTAVRHIMGYQHRYLAPLDPALCVLAAVGIERVLGWVAARSGRSALLRWAPLAAVGAVVAAQLFQAPAAVRDRLRYARGLSAAHEPLGRRLADLYLPGATLLISDAGAVPYLSGWWTLDLVGLNDARIATTGDRDPERLLAMAPEIVVLVSRHRDRFVPHRWNPWERPILEAVLAAGYRRVAVRASAPDYWLWVLARPGSAAGEALAQGR